MTPNKGLQVQEAKDLIALRNKLLNIKVGGGGGVNISALETLVQPKRAPLMCSKYNIQGHIRTRCPNC
jgi:hypothetical protein